MPSLPYAGATLCSYFAAGFADFAALMLSIGALTTAATFSCRPVLWATVSMLVILGILSASFISSLLGAFNGSRMFFPIVRTCVFAGRGFSLRRHTKSSGFSLMGGISPGLVIVKPGGKSVMFIGTSRFVTYDAVPCPFFPGGLAFGMQPRPHHVPFSGV